jgi:hypothetical protein
LKHPKYSSETPKFYQNDMALRNTKDVTGDKDIAVCSQSISGVSAINPLIDIYGRKEGVRFFYSILDITRDF